MVVFPNAKINIGLNILNRRSDGYHNLETIFYPINIKDSLEVIESDQLSFRSSGIEIPGHANENLCLKAWQLLRADYDIPEVAIHLHKGIPIGAGLGGGSADAAFFIKLMNEKYELNLTVEQMQQYARILGADCAFFIKNEPVFALEKGDVFEDLTFSLSEYFLVLVMPDVHVSTGEAYRGVKPSIPEKSLKDLIHLPIGDWKYVVKNDFEQSVFQNHPSIRGVKSELYASGAVYASMSGSGASVYGIFKNKVALPELEKLHQVFYNV